MAQYVLPCSCGRNIEVGTGQAGRTVRCECGAELEVPSIRGLERLELARPEAEHPVWGARQAVLFAGLLLATLGFIAGAFFYFEQPPLDDYATIRAQVDRWPVEQQRLYWEYVQEYGIRLATPEDATTVQENARFGRWSNLGFIAAAAGLAVAVAGALFLGRKTPARIPRTASAGGRPGPT